MAYSLVMRQSVLGGVVSGVFLEKGWNVSEEWVAAGRAAAAAGQGGLMSLYDSLFHMMDMQAAQVLVTSNDFSDANFRRNLSDTVEDLLAANVVPVFNENDAISNRPQTVEVGFWCLLRRSAWACVASNLVPAQ